LPDRENIEEEAAINQNERQNYMHLISRNCKSINHRLTHRKRLTSVNGKLDKQHA